MNFKKFQKAYTLVEMLTVVAIVIIMIGIIVTLTRPQKKFALQRNIYSFSASARRVQEMSMSIATVKIGNTETVPLGGYGIEMSTSATDDKNKGYILYYNGENDNLTFSDGESVENSPLKFSDGVYISAIEGKTMNDSLIDDIDQVNIIFYPPDPKILIFYNGDSDLELKEATIILKMSGTNFIRKIYINKLGLISVDQGQSADSEQ